MTTRGRSRKKLADEKFYPIRMRVRVPEEGLGNLMDDLGAWLDENAGRGRWGRNADHVLSREPRDSVSFYLSDIIIAAELVRTFKLELVVGDPDLCGEGSFKITHPAEGYWGNK